MNLDVMKFVKIGETRLIMKNLIWKLKRKLVWDLLRDTGSIRCSDGWIIKITNEFKEWVFSDENMKRYESRAYNKEIISSSDESLCYRERFRLEMTCKHRDSCNRPNSDCPFCDDREIEVEPQKAMRLGYLFCEKHQQEYLSYCCRCALDSHAIGRTR